MNNKLMTMLVACALSVSALSTTAVFAEDAAVTGETPAVTETTTTPETTPVAYEPEITLITPKWTGDSDIVFEVDAKGGAVYPQEMYVYGADDAAMPIISVPSRVEVNEEGRGRVKFTNDALNNAKTWDDTFTNQISVDWTKYSEIEFVFAFELNGQDKYRSMFVEASVKAPAPTVTLSLLPLQNLQKIKVQLQLHLMHLQQKMTRKQILQLLLIKKHQKLVIL